jgi:hypothetical protein
MPPADTQPTITRASLEADHPALFVALRDEFTAAGASAERARIQAVRAQVLAGHEALVETLAFDGRTTGPEAAAAVLTAERELRATQARAHAADAPKPAPDSPAPEAEAVTKSKADQLAEARAHMAANGGDIVAALKHLGYA